MTATGTILTLLLSVCCIICSRRIAVLSLIASALYITQGQAVQLGLNFMAIRFVEIAVFSRVVFRRELTINLITRTDRWLLTFLISCAAIYTLRSGNLDPYQIGIPVDACLVYFSVRALITTVDELKAFIKGMAVLLAPFAALMAYEAFTGQNPFSWMGGVPSTPVFRAGHYRCQGSFRHSITAGTLGATSLPLFVGLYICRESRRVAVIGAITCVTIVAASHSSGPLLALLVVVSGWACWRFRQHMNWVRRSIFAALLGLHCTMNAPIWYIFDRISGVIGGDGWHRANLIDKFILHWREWILYGMPAEDTGSWAATQLRWGGVDITNYYVSLGINSGVVGIAFFLMFLIHILSKTGRAAALARSRSGSTEEAIIWGVGTVLCTHIVNLTSVVYWDQSYVLWYTHIAIATSAAAHFIGREPRIDARRAYRPDIMADGLVAE